MKTAIRKLNLDEWFLNLQLNEIKKGFHLPFYLEANVTNFYTNNSDLNKFPVTALIVKAASILIEKNPEINKIFFRTIMGGRIVSPPYNGVNVPVEIKIDDKKILTGVTIHDAYKKSLLEINAEIKAVKTKKLDELPVNKIIHSPGIRFIKKMHLRIIHVLLKNCPNLYIKKKAGGISVSSLMNLSRPGVNVEMNAFGMTALTLSSCTLVEKDGQKLLKIGMAFDHSVIHGAVGTLAAIELVEILQAMKN